LNLSKQDISIFEEKTVSAEIIFFLLTLFSAYANFLVQL